jgi:hypothetical protein
MVILCASRIRWTLVQTRKAREQAFEHRQTRYERGERSGAGKGQRAGDTRAAMTKRSAAPKLQEYEAKRDFAKTSEQRATVLRRSARAAGEDS